MRDIDINVLAIHNEINKSKNKEKIKRSIIWSFLLLLHQY
jgi:hypothetical protein